MPHICTRRLHSALFALVVAVWFLSFAAPAEAQTSIRPGIRAGASVMTNGGNPARPIEGMRAGLVSGGFLALDFADAPGLRLELSYIQKGARVQQVSPSGGEEAAVRKLNYVETAVLGTLQLFGSERPPSSRDNARQLSALVGPTLGMRTHADYRDELSSGQTDYGLALGIEYRTAFGANVVESLVFDVRYQVGIASTEEQASVVVGGDGFDPHREGSFRNQGVTLTTGLVF